MKVLVLTFALVAAVCGQPEVPSQETCYRYRTVRCSNIVDSSFKPVCDRNGMVYVNKCMYTQAMCSNKGLIVDYCDIGHDVGSGDSKTTPKPKTKPSACRYYENLDCRRFGSSNKACDQNGNVYDNWCVYRKASCNDITLKATKCSAEVLGLTTPKPTVSSQCRYYLSVNCQRWKPYKMCDQNGFEYTNRCEFYQAICKDPEIKPGKCLPGSGDAILQSLTTTPKPTEKPSWCRTYERLNCNNYKKYPKICDTDGNIYENSCAYRKAWCNDTTLKTTKCSAEVLGLTTPKPTVSSQCRYYLSVNCQRLKPYKTCDQNGFEYANSCVFRKAWCNDTTLKIVKCSADVLGLTTPKPTVSSLCRYYLYQDCERWQSRSKICDQDGNEYMNNCEYSQARCKNPVLKSTQCQSGSGDVTTTLPTKPTKSSRCSYYEKLNCDIYDKSEVCDSNENSYKNRCYFYRQLNCGNSNLKAVKCRTEILSSTKQSLTKPSYCSYYEKQDCRRFGTYKVCDMSGNIFANKCEFYQAKCKNPEMEPSRCASSNESSDPSGNATEN